VAYDASVTQPSSHPDVRLATFPTDDAVFAAFVRGCWTGLHDQAQRSPAELERAIRRWHRNAVVREQAALAELWGATWYVYRDGRAGVRLEAGWWQEPGVARVRFDSSGRFIDANDAADALTGRRVEGARWTELVAPEATEGDAAWIWETIARDGYAQSIFELPLDGGTRRVIEYRTEVTDQPGEFVSYWRELTTIDR
jgi:PAS domain-containing protein